jgi:hypothetical protein
MQGSDLSFTFTQLPAGTTPALLQTYLSIFGEVGHLDFNSEQRAATVRFASAPHPDRILNGQHKFMGMAIAVSRAAAAAPPPPSSSDCAAPPSPTFRFFKYVLICFR